ncbi:nuclease [Streptomyces phage Alderaan]|nr:nuclease [Streptomyces phage Alderaan]
MSTPTPTSTAPSTGPTGDPGQGGDPTAQPGGQDPTTAPQGNPPAHVPTPAPTAPTPGEDPAATIARLQNELTAARKEAGNQRVTAKHRAADEARTELIKQFMAVIDPDSADKPATAEQLTQQLTAQQARTRSAELRLAVYNLAPAAGADAAALADSRAFADATANVDPADTAAVTAAITAAITANPRLAAQQPQGPQRGGADFTSGPSAVTAEQFAAMDYAARAELYGSDPDTYRRLAGG